MNNNCNFYNFYTEVVLKCDTQTIIISNWEIFLNVKHFAQLTSKIFRVRKIVEQKSKADHLQEVTDMLTP